jgi:hypothetical protein
MAREKSGESQRSPRSKERGHGDFTYPAAPSPEQKQAKAGAEEGDSGGGIPDFIRRAMAFGFTGFFATEEAMRRALGDTVPKDWIDFAAEQSERTRGELSDRFAKEFGRILDQVDLVQLASQILEGRSVEVSASIRLGPAQAPEPESEHHSDPRNGDRRFHTNLTVSTREESSGSSDSSDTQERRKPKGP